MIGARLAGGSAILTASSSATSAGSIKLAAMTTPRLLSKLAGVALALIPIAVSAADVERTGGPYVPTPQVVVDAMLDFARVTPKDYVIDLGSGDGRIVLTAAEKYKARGLGIDIDPELVQQSNAEATKRGIADRVAFREQDVLQAKIEEATVVTLYLLPGMMQQLQAKFSKELKPGTRIVSHDFPFGDWKPDREVSVDVPEKYGTPGNWKSTLFYWVVPARVQGAWQITAPGVLPQAAALTFEQRFQALDGAVGAPSGRVPLGSGRLEGNSVSFNMKLPAGAYRFTGTVEGERMRGEAVGAGQTFAWSAVRAD